ncbi:cell wall-binding repeat-containing protein [Desulfitobacterium sp. AusDCA]|uniref:cell wall-binding repeat-containing protein n=1 Tax=Desulfitobacterium sp. AusDCA TaxID=3240383 RepID=UPI003DA75A1F
MGKPSKILFLVMAAVLVVGTLFPPAIASAKTDTSSNIPAPDQVERFAGSDRYSTAVQISQNGWKQADIAVLSSGNDKNLVDALTAAPLAATKKAPLLLTQGDALNSSTKAELARLGVKTIYVTSGLGVISQAVLNELMIMNIDVKPLGGSDRFATSINIAKEVNSAPSSLVVATAFSNADALAIASIAAAHQFPIVLTNPESLTDSVKIYLDSIKSGVKQTYVLGGEGVISETVKASLPNSKRLAGSDRFATNIAILKEFVGDYKYDKLYLANGTDEHLVDALAGAPLAALTASGLMLTDTTMPAASAEYAKLNLSPNIVALGGESVTPTALLTGLAPSLVLADDNAVQGSSASSNPDQLAGSVKITGKNVTFQDATVSGTVFLDPGTQGTTVLNNVQAEKIVILSGDVNGIRLNNVTTDLLIVSSSSKVKIDLTGSTRIENTLVNSSAVLNAAGGTAGSVRLTNIVNQTPDVVVQLYGTFPGKVAVEAPITLKAVNNADLSNVEIMLPNKDQQVNLEGEFEKVQVSSEGKINLASLTTIKELVSNAKADISVPTDSRIIKYTDNGKNGKSNSGGTANGSTGVPGVSRITVTCDGDGTVANGYPLQMEATIMPSNAANQEITWSLLFTMGGNGVINPNTGLFIATEVGSVRVVATNTASGVVGTKDITVINAYQKVPTENLMGIAPTAYGKSDGKITGTTSAMEYKLSTSSTWTRATAPAITDLSAGAYFVRYAAKKGYNAGTPIVVIVENGPK